MCDPYSTRSNFNKSRIGWWLLILPRRGELELHPQQIRSRQKSILENCGKIRDYFSQIIKMIIITML